MLQRTSGAANAAPFLNSPPSGLNRRSFAVCLASLISGFGFARTTAAALKAGDPVAFPASEEISHSAEAIHQEVMFNAAPARVYDVLTDARQFDKVVQLSGAMRSGAISKNAAQISREAGGTFSLFGGYVTGRQIDLVPAQRIVQVWRSASWPAGAYSLARFELAAAGEGTKLVFDHTGYPSGQSDHLLAGWNGNYWEPLTKVLASC